MDKYIDNYIKQALNSLIYILILLSIKLFFRFKMIYCLKKVYWWYSFDFMLHITRFFYKYPWFHSNSNPVSGSTFLYKLSTNVGMHSFTINEIFLYFYLKLKKTLCINCVENLLKSYSVKYIKSINNYF